MGSLEGRDADLLDAVVRLVRLVETAAGRKVLAPLIIREIIYRLLIGGQGARLSHIFASGGDTRRISKAIGHLRKHFDEQLKMEEIARELGMSVSGFHHHFKSVTSMSPLQFQKHLRLQEARRLMLGEDLDAASAAFRVGYQDASHFSREYKRHFGAPPHGDIASLLSRSDNSSVRYLTRKLTWLGCIDHLEELSGARLGRGQHHGTALSTTHNDYRPLLAWRRLRKSR